MSQKPDLNPRSWSGNGYTAFIKSVFRKSWPIWTNFWRTYENHFVLGSLSNPHKFALILVGWIRIRIQEGKNYPQNRNNFENFMFWSAAGCSLLGLEDFAVARSSFMEALNFFQLLLIKILDWDWDSDPYPDMHWPKCWIQIRIKTQCGSETHASVSDPDPLVFGSPGSGCVIICSVWILIRILPSTIKQIR